MQLRKVVSWLSMHNFPYGVVSFADGISTDPLRHKMEYLKGGTGYKRVPVISKTEVMWIQYSVALWIRIRIPKMDLDPEIYKKKFVAALNIKNRDDKSD